jgi:SAM-dependent methyltransferase
VTWVEWFQRALAKYPTPWAYLFDSSAYMAPVIGAVKTIAPPPARLLEAGCGIGLTAMLLAAQGYEVYAVDRDFDVVSLADDMPWNSIFDRPIARLINGDFECYTAREFDIAVSAGVIEHESPERQVDMLMQLGRIARVQVVCIPGPLQLAAEGQQDMGEQPITLPQLVQRCQAAGWSIVQAFGWGDPPQFAVEREETPPRLWRGQQARGEKALSLCVIGRTA